MATGGITTATATNAIGELWAPDLRDSVEYEFIFPKLVNRQYEAKARSVGGDTMNIPYLSNIAPRSKAGTDDGEVTFDNYTEAVQVLTYTTQEYVAFRMPKMVSVQSFYDLQAEYTRKVAYGLARGPEVSIANLATSFNTNIVGTVAVALNDDELLKAQRLMDVRGAPMNGRFWVLSAAMKEDLLKIEKIIHSAYNGDSKGRALRESYVGEVYGAPTHYSNLLRSPAGPDNLPTSVDHEGFYCHRDGIYFVLQQPANITVDWVSRRLAWEIVGNVIYGAAEALQPPEAAGGGESGNPTDGWNTLVRGR